MAWQVVEGGKYRLSRKAVLVEEGDSDDDDGSADSMVDVAMPELGAIYHDAAVRRVEEYGLFVEFLPGLKGLVHVSELELERPASVTAWPVRAWALPPFLLLSFGLSLINLSSQIQLRPSMIISPFRLALAHPCDYAFLCQLSLAYESER